MGDVITIVQTSIEVGERHLLLSPGTDPEVVKRSIEEAIHGGGGFVDFIVVGNRRVSVFVNGTLPIALSVQTVPIDERDTGETATTYGGFYDAESSPPPITEA